MCAVYVRWKIAEGEKAISEGRTQVRDK